MAKAAVKAEPKGASRSSSCAKKSPWRRTAPAAVELAK
jgi:hypothetical protein